MPWKHVDCNLMDLGFHSMQGSSAARLHQNTDLHTSRQGSSLTGYHCNESERYLFTETQQTTADIKITCQNNKTF